MTTLAPSAASPSATARPIPLPAPVTTATFLSSSPMPRSFRVRDYSHDRTATASIMRFVKRLLLLAGAILLAVLVPRVGAEPVLATLRALAWWQFVIICLPYGVIAAVDTLGWRFAFARDGAPFWRLYGARLAGGALHVVTAAGSGGGEAVKGWPRRRAGPPPPGLPPVVRGPTPRA